MIKAINDLHFIVLYRLIHTVAMTTAYRSEHEDKVRSVVRLRARAVDNGKDVGRDPVEVRDTLWFSVEQVGTRVRLALLEVLIE